MVTLIRKGIAYQPLPLHEYEVAEEGVEWLGVKLILGQCFERKKIQSMLMGMV